MKPIGSSRVLSIAQAGIRRDLRAMFLNLSDALANMTARAAGSDGKIPKRSETAVLRQAGGIVSRYFVGFDGRSPFAADGITALAEYPRILNTWLAFATSEVVYAHQTWLQNNVPDDVVEWLKTPIPPVHRVREQDPGGNPLAQYDPPHIWVDPNGYRLSDRIWNTSNEVRQKIDRLIADAIRNGTSSFDLARQLEQFLLPTQTLRTDKPYGKDASYPAMRLARTEISHAHAQASLLAARMNPYVAGMDWALSPSHPRIDICDDIATLDAGGGRLREPYPLDAPQIPPAHPNCICNARPYVSESPAEVTSKLREMMQNEDEPMLTPVQADTMLDQMIGPALIFYLLQKAAA